MLPMTFTPTVIGDSVRYSGQLYGQNIQIKQGISIKVSAVNSKSVERDSEGKN